MSSNINPFGLRHTTPLNEVPTDETKDENSTINSGFLSMETNRSKGSNSSGGKVDLKIAEKNSKFDGPESYADLSVANFLELYLRSFIFHNELFDDSHVGMIDESNERSLPRFPRIQMCNDDSSLILQSPQIPIPDLSATINLDLHHETPHHEEDFLSVS